MVCDAVCASGMAMRSWPYTYWSFNSLESLTFKHFIHKVSLFLFFLFFFTLWTLKVCPPVASDVYTILKIGLVFWFWSSLVVILVLHACVRACAYMRN